MVSAFAFKVGSVATLRITFGKVTFLIRCSSLSKFKCYSIAELFRRSHCFVSYVLTELGIAKLPWPRGRGFRLPATKPGSPMFQFL